MLIPKETVLQVLRSRGVQVEGAFHIGAHDCEELDVYRYLGIPDKNVTWIDALHDKVEQSLARGIPNVYQAVISDTDGEMVTFYRTNNNQSSSILKFGTHATHYPWCVVTGTTQHLTKTIDTFISENNLDPSKFHFWNFDIQGAELKALKGGESAIDNVMAGRGSGSDRCLAPRSVVARWLIRQGEVSNRDVPTECPVGGSSGPFSDVLHPNAAARNRVV